VTYAATHESARHMPSEFHPSLLMIALVATPLVSAPPALGAQSAPVAPAYADRFAEVMAMSAVPDGVADVSDLVLQRDLARFTLKSGKLYLLTPIGGPSSAGPAPSPSRRPPQSSSTDSPATRARPRSRRPSRICC
jgi:hypothetical protein